MPIVTSQILEGSSLFINFNFSIYVVQIDLENKLLTFVLIRICDRILRRINAFVAVMLKSLAFRCDVTDLNFPEPQPSNPIFPFFFKRLVFLLYFEREFF